MAGHDNSLHIMPVKKYWQIYAILMVLLVLTVGVAYWDAEAHFPIPGLNIGIALAIAFVKMMYVILYFMHVKYSSRLVWIFAGIGFFFLLILFGITYSDYHSRQWEPVRTNWTSGG